MPIGFADPEEARTSIREKILSDWTLIYGDYGFVEKTIYPPGTELNEGFEIYIIPGVASFCLGRKTEELRAFLSTSTRPPSDEEFERLVAIEVHDLQGGFAAVKSVFANDPVVDNITKALEKTGL